MTSQTLSQRLEQGRVPVADALRYSMILAEALRKLHDSGSVHGAVSPETINITDTGVELLPAPLVDSLSSYKSPEVLDGITADARSDIFSFGAVVYEMLSGKRAFQGTDRTPMPQSGSPAVDRLVGSCVAHNPAARIQRIQKAMLELKLLSASAARASAAPIPRRDPHADAQLRAEMQQVEAHSAARAEANEKALAQMQRLADEVIERDANTESAIRAEMLQLESRVADRLQAHEKLVSDMQLSVKEELTAALRSELQQMEERLNTRLEQMDQRVSQALERIYRLEQVEPPADIRPLEESVEAIRHQVSELHDLVAEDFASFERSLHSQAGAIDSARTALAQTDDLVERVVEALESLQSTVLDNSEERALAPN